MRLVFLDTGVLGMVSNPRGKPRNAQCREWARGLLAAGVRLFVPEVCDYEERRKLIHNGATSGLIRLDRLKDWLDYAPITTDVMHKAAELWEEARARGMQTAGPRALDADAILAAQALLAAGPADVVTIATDNVGHLDQFADAQPWEKITP
jgi:predicted nucleic acid-binding protein